MGHYALVGPSQDYDVRSLWKESPKQTEKKKNKTKQNAKTRKQDFEICIFMLISFNCFILFCSLKK